MKTLLFTLLLVPYGLILSVLLFYTPYKQKRRSSKKPDLRVVKD